LPYFDAINDLLAFNLEHKSTWRLRKVGGSLEIPVVDSGSMVGVAVAKNF
jgi:hypothetical protein